jgi:hypothetical protein
MEAKEISCKNLREQLDKVTNARGIQEKRATKPSFYQYH